MGRWGRAPDRRVVRGWTSWLRRRRAGSARSSPGSARRFTRPIRISSGPGSGPRRIARNSLLRASRHRVPRQRPQGPRPPDDERWRIAARPAPPLQRAAAICGFRCGPSFPRAEGRTPSGGRPRSAGGSSSRRTLGGLGSSRAPVGWGVGRREVPSRYHVDDACRQRAHLRGSHPAMDRRRVPRQRPRINAEKPRIERPGGQLSRQGIHEARLLARLQGVAARSRRRQVRRLQTRGQRVGQRRSSSSRAKREVRKTGRGERSRPDETCLIADERSAQSSHHWEAAPARPLPLCCRSAFASERSDRAHHQTVDPGEVVGIGGVEREAVREGGRGDHRVE